LKLQLATHAQSVVTDQRERIYALTGSRAPFMTSRSETGIAKLALAYRDQLPRGIDGLSAEEQAAETAISAPRHVVDDVLALEDQQLRQLERAAQLLAAGRLDNAREIVAETEQDFGESAATLNLRAAIDMTAALELATPDQATSLRDGARDLLQRASQLDPSDPRPWFNLALLEEDLGNNDEARAAWREYLARETDAALKALVRSSRDL
jgi:tetratricopeptide (TPR) repeat protein